MARLRRRGTVDRGTDVLLVGRDPDYGDKPCQTTVARIDHRSSANCKSQ